MLAFIQNKYGYTLLEIAQKVGRTEAAVSRWNNGKSEPTKKNLQALKGLAVAPLGVKESPAAYMVAESDIVHLPVYGDVPAGRPDNWTAQEAIDFYPVPRRALKGNPKNGFVLTIRGNSMSPDLDEGDMVVVNPNLTPLKGEKVVARVDDGFTVKLWSGEPNRLLPINQAHSAVLVIEEGQLVGVVVIEMKISRTRKIK